MAAALSHEPDSHTNPYEPGPAGRVPERPVDGETVTVCATGPDTGPVQVEWERNGRRQSAEARRDGEHWTATFGPVAPGLRYRFTHAGEATSWFDLAVAVRRGAPVTGVAALDGTIVAAITGGTLTLTPDGGDTLRIEVASHTPDVETASTSAAVDGWQVQVTDGGLDISGPHGTWRLTRLRWIAGEHEAEEIEIGWRLHPDERLLGTGERFDQLDQRGRTPDVRVYEQYKQQAARTYLPLPLVVSTGGYAIHLDTAARVRFDLGAGDPDLAAARIPLNGQPLRATLWHGSPATVVSRYTDAVGRPDPLPLWVYGPWMSGNEWNSDARVRDVVTRTIDEQIPASVVVIEAWSDEASFYLFNDTSYELVDPADPVEVEAMTHGPRWPDPKATVDWLHQQGVRVLLWQIPVLKETDADAQHTRDLVHAEKHGYCVSTDDGQPYRNRGWWFPGARIIDFTNPDAARWWFRKRAWLVHHLGVDGFKTDGGEHLWGDDVRTHAGERGEEAANRYPAHYLAAYHRFLRDHGSRQPVTFSRAGFTGSQATPAHWAGDEDSTWQAYRASLTAGLSAGVCGVAWWGWDLAGFSGPLPTAELYQRATAMACFCPIMQYHSEYNEHRRPSIDRTPWNVAEQTGDPGVIDTYRHYAQLRMNLVPYLDTAGHHAARTGMPIMRAMALTDPDDPVAAGLDDQYMLGPDLLVAPVLEPGIPNRTVYLPAGRWYDLWDHTPHDGSTWIEVDTPTERIPVFLRAGAAIPLWVADPTVTLPSLVDLPGDGTGELALLITPGAGTTLIRDPRDQADKTVTVQADEQRLAVQATGLAGIPVRIAGHGETARIPHSGVLEVTL